VDGHVPVPRHDGVDAEHLHARRQHVLQVLHRRRPRKRLAPEQRVQKIRLLEDRGVFGLLHHGHVVLLLALELLHPVLHRRHARHGILRLAALAAVQEPQRAPGERQNQHPRAQSLVHWPQLDVGLRGEID
jgi:hypothetical protein